MLWEHGSYRCRKKASSYTRYCARDAKLTKFAIMILFANKCDIDSIQFNLENGNFHHRSV